MRYKMEFTRKKNNKKFKPPKELTIDRSKWRMGGFKLDEFLGETELLNSQGLACCLGFYSYAGGVGTDYLEGSSCPTDLSDLCESEDESFRKLGGLVAGFGDDSWTMDSKFASKAIGLNDGKIKSLRSREKKLKKLFKENGTTLKFVGRYPKEVYQLYKV